MTTRMRAPSGATTATTRDGQIFAPGVDWTREVPPLYVPELLSAGWTIDPTPDKQIGFRFPGATVLVGDQVRLGNSVCVCTVEGITGASQPLSPIVPCQMIIDGTAVWTCQYMLDANAWRNALIDPTGLLPAEYYGFSTADTVGTNNFNALVSMASAANAAGALFVQFVGTYPIRLPLSGEGGYLGTTESNSSACLLSNLVGCVIEASKATFVISNDVVHSQRIFGFDGCSGFTVLANFKGTHYGSDSNGVTSVFLRKNNVDWTLQIGAQQMRDGARLGNYEDPATYVTPTFQGNRRGVVNLDGIDTNYGVAGYLIDDVQIDCRSVGTAAGGYGAYRSVYLNGVTNIRAISKTKDMSIPDAVNIIASGPRADAPFHQGTSQVKLKCIDLGTTRYVQYQVLAKINIVTSSVQNTSILINDVDLDVHVHAGAVGWSDNNIIAFDAVGDGSASHIFNNIKISGRVGRLKDTGTRGTISVMMSSMGLKSVGVRLDGFQDLPYNGAIPRTFSIYSPAAVKFQADVYNSTVGSSSFWDPANQRVIMH